MHSRIFSPKIGFICGMAKIAVATLRSASRMSQPGGRKGTTTERPIGYGRPPCGRNGVFLPFRHSSSLVGIHRSDGTGLSERPNRPHRKTTCESPAVARRHHIRRHSGRRTTSTEKAPNSLSPHDRNVQERPRPDRRTETSAPRSERPAICGAKSPPNHHAKIHAFIS